MAPPDARTVVGNYVLAKASQVTHDASTIFGADWKSKKAIGSIMGVEIDYPKGWKLQLLKLNMKYRLISSSE